jgi:hypothetical protein
MRIGCHARQDEAAENTGWLRPGCTRDRALRFPMLGANMWIVRCVCARCNRGGETVKTKHLMGKHCGYDLLADGSIKPAPTYIDWFEKTAIQSEAIQSLLSAIIKECNKLSITAQQDRARLWRSLGEDYSLDMDKYEWSFNGETKLLSKKKKPEEKD